MAALISIVLALVAIVLVAITLVLVSRWYMFKKMGMPGWYSLIPFYSSAKELEYTHAPLWWIFLLIIPIVSIIPSVILIHRLAVVFGKGWWFTIGLIFLPFIFYPILGFGKATYENTYPKSSPITPAIQYSLIAGFVFLALFAPFPSDEGFHAPIRILAENSPYAADDMYVYYSDKLLPKADPDTFEVEGAYGYDHRTAYYGGEIIKGVDAGTFTVIGDYWAKDKDRVYSDGNVIVGADPATFELIDVEYEYYGRDATQVFTYDGVIKGAEPETFVPLQYGYAKDAKNVYYNMELMSDADVSTFTVSGYDLDVPYDAQDKNHTYSSGKIYKAPSVN
ncbi:hypothetical protein A2389_03295 [Candidatus Adlerbacteria bacterium RIFOXYB1_FULL_48_10]|nr:MAG: hypothetical protein A2389_03295 [Candidatus Adlerbacteria bacterium RIFOXYB1_FULL_48_10]OGC96727.1 MAG: hypothetical protein A2590_02695 [Candidatus Adlerbacteria bacterium RIFOXYD1_FULL_48_8]